MNVSSFEQHLASDESNRSNHTPSEYSRPVHILPRMDGMFSNEAGVALWRRYVHPTSLETPLQLHPMFRVSDCVIAPEDPCLTQWMTFVRRRPIPIGVPKPSEEVETLGRLQEAQVQVFGSQKPANFKDPNRRP